MRSKRGVERRFSNLPPAAAVPAAGRRGDVLVLLDGLRATFPPVALVPETCRHCVRVLVVIEFTVDLLDDLDGLRATFPPVALVPEACRH